MSEYIIDTVNMPEHVREILEPWIIGSIVRCRDCMYICNREYANGFVYHTCSYFDSEHAEIEPDGFCKWAIRGYDD